MHMFGVDANLNDDEMGCGDDNKREDEDEDTAGGLIRDSMDGVTVSTPANPEETEFEFEFKTEFEIEVHTGGEGE